MRDVNGYEGLYKIGIDGRVWSKIRKGGGGIFLKARKNSDGYWCVVLCKDGICKSKRMHRLLAEAYIENPEGKKDINHINGLRGDNRLKNLEWSTRSENITHSYRTLGRIPNYGERSGRAVLSEREVKKILKMSIVAEVSQRKVADTFNVSRRCIRSIVEGTNWPHLENFRKKLLDKNKSKLQ